MDWVFVVQWYVVVVDDVFEQVFVYFYVILFQCRDYVGIWQQVVQFGVGYQIGVFVGEVDYFGIYLVVVYDFDFVVGVQW